MTQRIKFNLYGILFRFFSFLADKTEGNSLFVKPKVLLGSMIVGLSSGSCSTTDLIKIDNIQPQSENMTVENANASTNKDEIFCYHTEQPPQFPGGEIALFKYMSDSLSHPVVGTCYQGIPGRVVLKFVVNEDGSISDITVLKSLEPYCDKEAIRVVSLMPEWIPGKQNGEVCKIWYILPVYF